MKALSILGGALLVAVLLAVFPVVRSWWQSTLSRPKPAILLMLAIAGTMIGTGEKADVAAIQSGLPDAYRVVRVLLAISLFLIASLGIFKEPSRIRLAGSGARWMIVYALLAMTSAIYSVDGFISLWKGFEVLTLVLVVVSLAGQMRTTEDLGWLINVISLILLYIVLTVYVGVAIYPSEAIKDQEYLGVRGLMPPLNPTSVGSISSLLAICAIGIALYRWPSKAKTAGAWVILLAAVGTLILAHSRTPIFACAIAMILMLIVGKHYRLAILTAVVGTGFVFAMSIDDIMAYIYRGQTEEAFTGLSGRLYFWDLVWPTFTSAPIFGNGYYAAHRELFGVSSVDNTYLEVLLGLGIFGLSIFLIPVLLSVKALIRMRPRSNMPIANKYLWSQIMGLFVIIVLRGYTAPTFQVQHPLLIIYMVTQIGIALILRLNSDGSPAQTVEMQESNEEPTLHRKKKLRILSTRRQ